ncbi:MAG: glycosyltransferase family 2 protein [Leptospira sp.]|nr:glycosyltransferase family 2 protein [Leptospira sp.]
MKNLSASDIFCIIPARNEEKNIPNLLMGLLEIGGLKKDQILIVNNGSTDQTEFVLSELDVPYTNEPNIGYGSAILRGLDTIKNQNKIPNFILICDADGSDDPEDIRRLYHTIVQTDADLVIGSRLLGTYEESSLSAIQIFGNRLVCFLILLFYRKRFTDLGPLRLIRYSSLLDLDLKDKTWGWNIEMHLMALEKNKHIVEIPVNYRKRFSGVSKISGTLSMSMRVGFRILYTFFRIYILGRL